MLLALSSNQKLGLALVAAVFVVFALVSAMVIPRSRPDFPGSRLGIFLGIAGALTVAMLLTVAFVARESGEEEHAAVTETQPAPAETTEPAATEAATTTEAAPTETSPAETETATSETAATTETAAPTGDATAGKALFGSTCGGCHTLSDAGTDGTVGPNLDDVSPSFDKVVERVTHGKGPMPAFGDSGTLTEAQIQDVAAYVSSAAGS